MVNNLKQNILGQHSTILNDHFTFITAVNCQLQVVPFIVKHDPDDHIQFRVYYKSREGSSMIFVVVITKHRFSSQSLRKVLPGKQLLVK